MRLIDADALCEEWLYENGMFEPNDVLGSIDDQPTIDAVPVVRCAECRNAEHTLWSTGEMYCTIWKMNPRPTGYCYLGAKMDGGAADGSD